MELRGKIYKLKEIEKMSEKSYKIPAILGAAFYILAVVIGIVVTVIYLSVAISNTSVSTMGGAVIPWTVIRMIIVMIVYIAFMLTVILYKGSKRRMIGVILFIVMALVAVFSTAANYIINMFFLRSMGSMAIAATSTLNNALSVTTSLFTFLANLFMIIGIARFGVSTPEEEEEEDGQ